jgi:transposase
MAGMESGQEDVASESHEDCRLVMDRDDNSAINILKRFLARRGPHTGDPVRCADVFTAIEHV